MAMITRKFKKIFKKAEGNFKKGSTSKPRGSDRDRFSCCFRCGKHDHIMKNCPMQKEEQGSEQFRNRGKRLQQSSSARHFTKAMMASWGKTSEEEEGSQEEGAAVAPMARSKSESDFEPVEVCPNSKIRYVVLAKLKLRNYCLL